MGDDLKLLFPAGQPRLDLRPERPGDEAFLLELYGSTRAEELALTGWDAATRAAFVRMQFNAMRQGYAGMFPHGQFSVVLRADHPIGRMVIDRAEHEIRLVDMALMPAARCSGIGACLVQSLQAEAQREQKPVLLHVLKGNRATRLYERLGFRCTADQGMHEEMTWHPLP